MKLVDLSDSKSDVERRTGSSPVLGTTVVRTAKTEIRVIKMCESIAVLRHRSIITAWRRVARLSLGTVLNIFSMRGEK